MGTDGTGSESLIIRAGGFRRPSTEETRLVREREAGNWRSDEDLEMNGPEVFAFTLREVPQMISRILGQVGWKPEDVNAFVFHQANKFMLDYLCKKSGIPTERVPTSLEFYGNTSSASIPLTIASKLRDRLLVDPMDVVLAGFGVGWSWGAAAGRVGPTCVLPVIEIEDDASTDNGSLEDGSVQRSRKSH